MIFFQRLAEGARLAWRAVFLVWRYKCLLWYGLLHMLAHHGACGAMILCGVPIYATVRMCYWFYFPGVACVVCDSPHVWLAMVMVGLFSWVIAIVYAVMLKHIQTISNNGRFDLISHMPDGQLLIRLIGVAGIQLFVISFITLVGFLICEWVALLVFIPWYFSVLLVMPLLVYKRLGLFESFTQSMVLMWRIFAEIMSSILSMTLFAFGSLFGLRVIALVVAMGVCFAISVPLCMQLLVPYLLFNIPLFFALWYVMTAVMVLPALLALKIISEQ